MNAYGFFIVAGSIAGHLVVRSMYKGEKVLALWEDSVFLVVVFAIIGARLYHVVHFWHHYSYNVTYIFMIWKGGLGIWGAIIGAIIGLTVFLWKKKEGTLQTFIAVGNIYALMAPLVQAIGRVGNYFNKEIFGYPTELPWGIFIPRKLRPDLFINRTHFHPLFFYELVLNLFLFFLLLFIFKTQKRFKHKKISIRFVRFLLKVPILVFYLVGYSLIRIGLEPLRIDFWSFFGYPVASIIGFTVIIGSLSFMFLFHSKLSKVKT